MTATDELKIIDNKIKATQAQHDKAAKNDSDFNYDFKYIFYKFYGDFKEF